MEKFENIPTPPDTRRKFDFTQFNSGSSTHVKTDRERKNVLIAFKYWSQHTPEGKRRKGAYATSRKVDDTDPAGPGYRIWFLKREAALSAAVAPQDAPNTTDDI